MLKCDAEDVRPILILVLPHAMNFFFRYSLASGGKGTAGLKISLVLKIF